MDQDLTQFSDKILCGDSTGCDEVDTYFAIEVDTIIAILYEYVLVRIGFENLQLTGTFSKLSYLNV